MFATYAVYTDEERDLDLDLWNMRLKKEAIPYLAAVLGSCDRVRCLQISS